MSSRPPSLLRAALSRLVPVPPPDSDAELLAQYVADRNEHAFTVLVRRHGPMVLGICRRRLGAGPDAEDAAQVVFLVLARDAGRIGNGSALAGWLARVAYRLALKQSGRRARLPGHLPAEVPAMPGQTPADLVAGQEHLAILDEELDALPEKYRSVLVLCALEERTNSEAARMLGCPTGTIDSRLSTARAKLRDRLARRGLATLTLVWPATVETLSADETARVALAYVAAAGTASDSLSTLANGVTPMLSTSKVPLFVATGLALTLLGTAGLGLISATGQEPPKPVAKQTPKTEPPPATAPAKSSQTPAPRPGRIPSRSALIEDEIWIQLKSNAKFENLGEIPFGEFLRTMNQTYGVNARLDKVTFQRLSLEAEDGVNQVVRQLEETKITLPEIPGLTLADVLSDAIAQLPIKLSYRVRGNQILIGPAFQPPTLPGAGTSGEIERTVDSKRLLEQVMGEPVSLAIDDRPLTDAVKELRALTGANIVFDARCRDQAKQMVSGAFSDVRLLTVLTVLGDMANLKPVAMNNVYYLTTTENAARLQKQVNEDLFGPQPMAVPAGYVTDGLHLYEKPANLKKVEPSGLGGAGGFGGGPVGGPPPGVVPAPPSEKK